MFIHCTKCDWCQDDFWSEEYNPVRREMERLSKLVEKAIDKENPEREYKTDRIMAAQRGMPFGVNEEGFAVIDIRDYIAKSLEVVARSVRKMHWLTKDDFDKDSNQRCPTCGSELTVD